MILAINLLIGASVILECLFAKLRQHILSAYRPGSIIIDGGGRIEFFTKKDGIEEVVMKVIKQSLLVSANPHPFQHIIQKNYDRLRTGKEITILRKRMEHREEYPSS